MKRSNSQVLKSEICEILKCIPILVAADVRRLLPECSHSYVQQPERGVYAASTFIRTIVSKRAKAPRSGTATVLVNRSKCSTALVGVPSGMSCGRLRSEDARHAAELSVSPHGHA